MAGRSESGAGEFITPEVQEFHKQQYKVFVGFIGESGRCSGCLRAIGKAGLCRRCILLGWWWSALWIVRKLCGRT